MSETLQPEFGPAWLRQLSKKKILANRKESICVLSNQRSEFGRPKISKRKVLWDAKPDFDTEMTETPRPELAQINRLCEKLSETLEKIFIVYSYSDAV